MLWRALQHVQDGFYIDVGAADPVEMSVTRVFYDHGWHGINLEPNDDYFNLLQAARPRDINLKLGAGQASGQQVFHSISGTGLSTFDATVAQRHRQDGWTVTEHAVETLTLAELCRQHRPTGPIHFLKVDVEGAEAEVLAGADFQAFRPWIVLVEATEPLSQEQSHAGWESHLTTHGYQFVWFDGLNRFYLADEKMAELSRHFRVQPNIFDGFVPAPVFQRQAEENYKAVLDAQAVNQKAQAAQLEAQAAFSEAQEAHQDALAKAHTRYEAELSEERQRAQAAWHRVSETLNQQNQRAAQLESRAVAAENRIAALQVELSELGQAKASLAQLLANEQQATAEAHQGMQAAQARLAELHGSTSWRVTRPMRVLVNLMRGQVKAKAVAREVFRRGVRRILGAPAGRRLAQKARTAAPGLAQWFLLRYRAYEQTAAATPAAYTTNPASYLPVPMAQACTLAVELDLSEEEARLYRSFASYRLSLQATR